MGNLAELENFLASRAPLGSSLAKSSSKDLFEGLRFVPAQDWEFLWQRPPVVSLRREMIGTRARTHGFTWFWLCNNRRRKKKNPEINFLKTSLYVLEKGTAITGSAERTLWEFSVFLSNT